MISDGFFLEGVLFLYQRPFVFYAFFIEKFHENSNTISIKAGRTFFLLFLIFYSPLVFSSEVMDVWRNNRAVDQIDQKKFLQAHEGFNQLLSERMFHPVFQFNLGFSFLSLGEIKKAIKMYKEILRLHPLPPEIEFSSLYNLGVLYSGLLEEDMENLDKALHFYQGALKFKPDSKEVKTNIELLFRGSGGKGNKRNDQKSQRDKEGRRGPVTNKPEKEENQKKYKIEKMSKKDVERILNELKEQEQNIRAKYKRKKFREADREKNW